MPSQKLRRTPAGTVLHRIHRLVHDPIFFGPGGSAPEQRYDDPNGNHKVLYSALNLATSFAETLVRVPTVKHVLSSQVLIRARSELITTRTLNLYPLVDGGVSMDGLTFGELHTSDYAETWKMSAAVYAETAADGILYTSRFDSQDCIALFDRAATAIATTKVRSAALTPELATDLAASFGKIYVEP